MAEKGYTITLKNQTDTEAESPIAGSEAGTQKAAPSGGTVKNAVKELVAYSKIKPFIAQVINHEISTVTLRTGSQELQQRISFAYDTVSQAVNIGESIATGFILGRGPGAVAGAIIGVGFSIINYANRQRTLELERSLETISNSMLDQRAGGFAPSYSGSRSRDQ